AIATGAATATPLTDPEPTGSPTATTPPRLPSTPAVGPLATPLGPASATPLVRAVLDARLDALRRKAGIPGIAATILFADGTVWDGAAGLAEVAAGRRVTPGTAFPIASVSKTFTAALVLSLIQDGKLTL